MQNENQNTAFWHFSDEEVKILVKLLHNKNPIDPNIYHFYNYLLSYLYERMTFDEGENLLK